MNTNGIVNLQVQKVPILLKRPVAVRCGYKMASGATSLVASRTPEREKTVALVSFAAGEVATRLWR